MSEETKHSIYGASGASRWRNCRGSVRVIEDAKAQGLIPEDNGTSYSKEGDVAHDYAAKVLTGKMLIGDMPDEFREHLEGYIVHCSNVEKYALETFKGKPNQRPVLVEKPVALFFRPQDEGTVDHAVVCPDFIHVTDLKYGAGVKVDAEDNDQGLIYTISLLEELEIMHGFDFSDDTPVYITVYQPRHRDFTGEPDTWETNVGYLRGQAKEIVFDYELARNASAEDCTASEKACRFCDAKKVCAVRAKTSFGGLPEALDINADFDFEDDTKAPLPAKAKDFDRTTLTTGQIAWICTHGKTLKKIIDDVTQGEYDRIQAGGELQKMKLIEGPDGNRTWVDPEQAEKFVRALFGASEAYKPRVILTAPQTLAKAKGHLDELSTIQKIRLGLADETEKTKSFIHRPKGKPKLVPIDAKGEALVFTKPEDDFEDETEEKVESDIDALL